jgi:hypothetical protein
VSSPYWELTTGPEVLGEEHRRIFHDPSAVLVVVFGLLQGPVIQIVVGRQPSFSFTMDSRQNLKTRFYLDFKFSLSQRGCLCVPIYSTHSVKGIPHQFL